MLSQAELIYCRVLNKRNNPAILILYKTLRFKYILVHLLYVIIPGDSYDTIDVFKNIYFT